jgi:hypothetical protein
MARLTKRGSAAASSSVNSNRMLAGSGSGVSTAADPRKDAMQSGVALVMRGLLQTMYAYCEGPPSTPRIEAELGKQLIKARRVLQRYSRHVASGAVGNVRSQGWATHRVQTNRSGGVQ